MCRLTRLHGLFVVMVFSVVLIGLTGCSVWGTDEESQKIKMLSEEIGSPAEDNGYDVVVDSVGNIYVTGSTKGILLRGETPITVERFPASPARTEFDDDLDAYLIKYNPDGSIAWAKQWGTPEDDGGYSLALDPYGNIYVAGMTAGDLWGEGAGNWDLFVEKYSPDGEEREWAVQWGAGETDIAEGIAVDTAGNAYVVGTIPKMCGGGAYACDDGFFSKIDSTGTVLWTKTWDSPENLQEAAHAIAIYGTYAFVVGDTTGTLQTGQHIGNRDNVLMKFDKDATSAPDWVWVKQWGTNLNDYLYDIAMDRTGNLYLTGITSGVMYSANVGGKDMFVQKFSATMTATSSATWTKQVGSTVDETVSSITVDIAGTVYVAGTTAGNYDGNTSSGGSTDFFFTRFSNTGTKLWSHQKGVGQGLVAYTRSVGIDPAGKLYIAGHTGGTIPATGQIVDYDIFLYKYVDSQKNWVFTREFGTTTEDKASASATDGSGNTYVTGYTFGALPDGASNLGQNDAFLIRYNSDGSKAWTRQWGSSAQDGGAAVAIDADRNIIVAGVTAGALTDQHGQSLPYSGSYDLFVAKFSPAGTLLWMKEWGTTQEEWAYDVHIGANGKIYVTGYTGGTSNRNGIVVALTDHTSFALLEWSQTFGSSGSSKYGYSVTTDSGNNVYVSGKTSGALSGYTSAGGVDNVLFKYDTDGAEIWHRQWGSNGNDYAYSVAFDKLETALYISGTTSGVLGSGNIGGIDAFLQKLSLSGTVQWTQQFGTTGNETETRLVLDADDYIYLVGTTTGAFTGATNAGGTDAFVARYDMFGYQSWVKQRGSAGNEETRFITIDDAGNLYVAGATNGDLDGNVNAGGSCSGSTCADIYIMKFSDEPSKSWPKQWGSNQYDYGFAVATDPQGNAIAGGSSNGNVHDQTVTASGSTCGSTTTCSDNILAKWMPNGTRLWTRMWGSDKADEVKAVATDELGNIYATGYTKGHLDGNTNPNPGTEDIFLTKYTADGTKVWTKQWGTTGANIGYGITTDNNGNIYVTGTTVYGLDGKSAIGSNDIFITKWNDTGADATKEWTKVWGNTSYDYGYAIRLDNNNGLYVAGVSYGSTGAQKDGETYSGNYDLVLMKWSIGTDDNSTVREWTKLWGSSVADYANALEVDQNNDIYVTGYTTGTLPNNVSQGGYDAFLTKWTQSGTTASMAWTKQWGSPPKDNVQIINWALTSSGSTYSSAGYGSGTFSGGSGIGTITYNASGATASGWSTGAIDLTDYYQVYFIPKTGNAVTVTAINFSEKRSDIGIGTYKVKYSKSSSFTNPVDLATVTVPDNTDTRSGNITGLNISVGMGESIYIRFYGYNAENANGNWTIAPNVNIQATAVLLSDISTSITLDLQGNVYVGGYTRGGLDGNRNQNGAYQDYFISKFVEDGTREWTYQGGSTTEEWLYGLARDNSNNIYGVGYTQGDLPYNTTAGGLWDMYLIKMSENGGSLETQTVSCADDPDRPSYSQNIASMVSVSYSTAGGWSQPAYCDWECVNGYVLIGGDCVEKVCDEGMQSTITCTVVEDSITGLQYRTCLNNAWVPTTQCIVGCTVDTSTFVEDAVRCNENGGKRRYFCNEDGAWELFTTDTTCYCDTTETCDLNEHCEVIYDSQNEEWENSCECDNGFVDNGSTCVAHTPIGTPEIAGGSTPNAPDATTTSGDCVSNSTVTLVWSDTGSTYTLLLDTDPQPSTAVVTDGTADSYTTTTLSAATRYYWQVIAKDDYDFTASSPVYTFTTCASSTTPPTAPASLSASSVGSSGVVLTWNTGSNLTYRIFKKLYAEDDEYYLPIDSLAPGQYTVSSTAYRYIGLEPSTDYQFAVEACNSEKVCSSKTETSSAVTTSAIENTILTPESLDPNAIIPFFDRVKFIFTNYTVDTTTYEKVQHFFEAETITDYLDTTITYTVPKGITQENVAVIKGVVTDINGGTSYLENVLVHVKDHPEFGYTYTRPNGEYTLAVPGGLTYTLLFSYKTDGTPPVEYLPVSRTVTTTVNSYSIADTVALLEKPASGTAVDIDGNGKTEEAAAITVVSTDGVDDGRGERNLILNIPAGTGIEIELADGTKTSLTGNTATITAVEYTATDNGQDAMPARLPEGTAYTYCIELKVAEAETLGAKSVSFSRPVYTYLDNFIDVPVGFAVPAGYYDRDKDQWIASEDGIVLRVVGSYDSGTYAQLDMNGDGVAESEKELNEKLGIEKEELATILDKYPDLGKTFWRVPIQHFTPWDLNWSWWGFDDDVYEPSIQLTEDNTPTENTCKQSGSIIDCENGTFGETLRITDVSNELIYNSGRTSGDSRTKTIEFEDTVPFTELSDTFMGAEYHLYVDGCLAASAFAFAESDHPIRLSWNGEDCLGNRVNGTTRAKLVAIYWYKLVYAGNLYISSFTRSFGGVTQGDSGGSGEGSAYQKMMPSYPTPRIVPLKQEYSFYLGGLSNDQKFGGWSFENMHRLDRERNLLYKGNGETEQVAEEVASFAKWCGFPTTTGFLALNQASTLFNEQTTTVNAEKIIVASSYRNTTSYPNGIFEISSDSNRVCRVTDLANTTAFNNNTVAGLRSHKEGTVYVMYKDQGTDYGKIYSIKNGVYTHVVGASSGTFGGENEGSDSRTLAFGAAATWFEVLDDYSIYLFFAYNGFSYIYKINSDGSFKRLGSDNTPWFESPSAMMNRGDSFSETSKTDISELQIPTQKNARFITHYTKTGQIIFALPDYACAFSIDPATNIVTRVFGDACEIVNASYDPLGYEGYEGKEATGTDYDTEHTLNDAQSWTRALHILSVSSLSDGTLLFLVDYGVPRRKHIISVNDDNLAGKHLMHHLAGIDYVTDGIDQPNYGPIYETRITDTDSRILVDRNDTIFFMPRSFYYPSRADIIYIKKSRFETVLDNSGTMYVPSKDGAEVYVFDREGYHLRTLDAVTGTTIYTFEYDTCTETRNGNTRNTRAVNSITDRFGKTTTMTRDGNCKVTAITSPNGIVTNFLYNDTNDLSSTSYPNSSTALYSMTYYPESGLLESITDPRYNTKWVYYTEDGMFEREVDALGAQKTLTVSADNDATKDFVSAEGIKTSYKTTDEGKEVTFADGTVNKVEHLAEKDIVTYADGTTVTTKKTPDERLEGSAEYTSGITVTTGVADAVLTYSMTVDREIDMTTDSDELPDDDVPVVFKFDKITDIVIENGRTNTITLTNNHDGTYTEEYRVPAPVGDTRNFTVLFDEKGRLLEQSSSGVTEPVGLSYYDDVNDPDGAKNQLQTITQGAGNTRREIGVTYYDTTGSGAFKGAISSITRLEKVIGGVDYYLTSVYSYNSRGWVTSVMEYDENDDLIGTIGYVYDDNGNVTSVTPMGSETHDFFYNALDQTDYYQPPLVETQMKTYYAYDKDGRVADIYKPDETLIHYKYATASEGYSDPYLTGKLQAILVDDVEKVTYAYESTGAEKLSTIMTADDTSTLTYGYNGALLASEAWSGAVVGTVSRSYNNDFKVASLTVGSTTINYAYVDPAGLMTGAGDLSIDRDETSGRIVGTSLSGTVTVTTEQGYDDYGDIESFSVGSAPYLYRYEVPEETGRDNLGRIVEREEIIDGGTPTTYTYTYDSAGRLQEVDDGTMVRRYEYDENGNRMRYLEDGNPIKVVPTDGTGIDAQDRLLQYGDTYFTYTTNGDLLTKINSGNTTTYTHDPFGNLTSVALPSGGGTKNYVYDGRNRLIARKNGSTVDYKLIYAGQLAPVAKLQEDNTVIETYVYATGSNSPDYIIRSGVKYRVIKDHLGSVRMIVRTTDGVVVTNNKYDEFGNLLTGSSDTFGTIFGFAGGIRDTDTGLTKFGARWYDPVTGRWLEKEPLGFEGSYNFYSYCDGDPVNWVDMNGNSKTQGLGHGDDPIEKKAHELAKKSREELVKYEKEQKKLLRKNKEFKRWHHLKGIFKTLKDGRLDPSCPIFFFWPIFEDIIKEPDYDDKSASNESGGKS